MHCCTNNGTNKQKNQNMYQNKKNNILKSMRCSKSRCQSEIYVINIYIKKKVQENNLSVHHKELEKEESQLKFSREWKKQEKSEINKIETRINNNITLKAMTSLKKIAML